jgi:hypothetical protein
MFRAPLCPSSEARECYTGGCCLSYLVLWFSSCRYGVELRVVCPVCGLLLYSTGGNHLYNTLELLMMGIVVPETCWASNKICNKNHLLHLVGILFPHINDDARSKSLQMYTSYYMENCGSLCVLYLVAKVGCALPGEEYGHDTHTHTSSSDKAHLSLLRRFRATVGKTPFAAIPVDGVQVSARSSSKYCS